MNIFSKLINIDSYKDIGVSNLNPSFFACYLKKLHDETKQAVVVVFSNMYEANKIYNELLNITSPLLYQVDNLIEEMSYASSKELKLERLNTLKELATDPNRIVLTDVSGYLGRLMGNDEGQGPGGCFCPGFRPVQCGGTGHCTRSKYLWRLRYGAHDDHVGGAVFQCLLRADPQLFAPGG